jgi:hypothetical protein
MLAKYSGVTMVLEGVSAHKKKAPMGAFLVLAAAIIFIRQLSPPVSLPSFN